MQVIRWTDASYLEGQDAFHMSGLHRDVYLVATPQTFVRDHVITAQLDASKAYTSGKMEVSLELDNRRKLSGTKQIKVTLLDADNKVVKTATTAVNYTAAATTNKAKVMLDGLANLKPWTAETPYLYNVVVAQQDDKGKEEMVFNTKYGFRNIEIKNGLVLINGKRVFFKGVNTQDTHPYGCSYYASRHLYDETSQCEHGAHLTLSSSTQDVCYLRLLRTLHYGRS